jgi:hypothetical protein
MRLSTAKLPQSPSPPGEGRGVAPKFYIQCKGLHSGRPLNHYIPNSFAVYTDDPNAFSKVFILWKARIYEPDIIGSVVPFIRITDMRRIHKEHLPSFEDKCPKLIATVQLLEDALKIKMQEIEKLKDLQLAFARQIAKPP